MLGGCKCSRKLEELKLRHATPFLTALKGGKSEKNLLPFYEGWIQDLAIYFEPNSIEMNYEMRI